MVDVVANHMGKGAIADNRPSPLDQASSYHSPACVIDYNNQTSIEFCRIDNLPDVNTQSSDLRTLYQTWVKWLVTEYSFDGVRIDTVRHVEKDFWPGFASAAGVYSIGEVFSGDATYLLGYAKTMSGLLNYATYYPMNNFYQQKGTSQAMVDSMNTIRDTFPDPSALGTFLDNHDNARWLNQKNDTTLLKNALAFVILSRGIPIVYYGTEQSYSGAADPANREDLWRSNFNTNADLYQAIKKLTAARKSAGGLAGNDHTHLYVASNAYAFSRANGTLVVLTTNAGSSSNAQHCFSTQKANGVWTNVYGSSSTVTADGSGNICVTVSNGDPIVLLASTVSTSTAAASSAIASSVAATLSTQVIVPASTTLATSASACPSAVAVSFTHKVTTAYGDTIKISGNTTQLGNWTPASAPALSAASYTSSNPVWTITLSMTAGSSIQYKFVKVSSSGTVTWESDPNRAYTVPKCQASASLSSTWQ